MIKGLLFKKLETHRDQRGFFREIFRLSQQTYAGGELQISHSLVHEGTIKAWHYHKRQWDWWYIVEGLFYVAFWDHNIESTTFGVLDHKMVGGNDPWRPYSIRIPPNVWHGYRCVRGPGHILYVTSLEYDGTDEFREPHDYKDYFDWERGRIKKWTKS